MTRTFVPVATAVAMTVGLASCAGEPGVGPDGQSLSTPGVHVLAGAGISDTVEAIRSQALVVRVVGANGKPMPNLLLRFTTTSVSDSSPFPNWRATMFVSRLSATGWGTFVADSTNAKGEAAVLVRMGIAAGTGLVIINAPVTGYVDTVEYTVRPGAASRLTVAPRDTSLYVGGQVPVSVKVVDRHGNPLPQTLPVLTPSNDRAVVNGHVASGAKIGRSSVMVTLGSLRDSVLLTVVPRGSVAAYTQMQGSGDALAIFTFDLDGTRFRKLTPSAIWVGYFGDMPLAWSVDGQSIFFHDNKGDHTKMLWVVDAASGASRRLLDANQRLADERYPTRSADGQWIYFNGPEYGVSQIYRARVDGSSRELVSPAGVTQSYPHPSPDGSLVVYSAGGRIEVMGVVNKSLTRLGVAGQVARWSPVGDVIAIRGDDPGFFIVAPDGSAARHIAAQTRFGAFFDWSLDGKYLVATVNGTVTLVDVATGEQLPIKVTAISHGLAGPSWKP